jgi:hypothetical protein
MVLISMGEAVGDLSVHLALALNGMQILFFAYKTVRHALGRNIAKHREWALGLFLATSGVWFFRIGLMFWFMVNGGPVGVDMKSFTGPFLTFLTFAQYLIPLLILQCYLFAHSSKDQRLVYSVSGLLLICTCATAVGIVAATGAMWLPRITNVLS